MLGWASDIQARNPQFSFHLCAWARAPGHWRSTSPWQITELLDELAVRLNAQLKGCLMITRVDEHSPWVIPHTMPQGPAKPHRETVGKSWPREEEEAKRLALSVHLRSMEVKGHERRQRSTIREQSDAEDAGRHAARGLTMWQQFVESFFAGAQLQRRGAWDPGIQPVPVHRPAGTAVLCAGRRRDAALRVAPLACSVRRLQYPSVSCLITCLFRRR